jgi:hypothetical protein
MFYIAHTIVRLMSLGVMELQGFNGHCIDSCRGNTSKIRRCTVLRSRGNPGIAL